MIATDPQSTQPLPRKRKTSKASTPTVSRGVSPPPTAPPPTRVGPAETITVIPLGQLERHPQNRVIDPASPEILELSRSIAEHGQIDPLRVRPLGDGRYQIISGERRYHALTLAGSYGAHCIVVQCDDATALSEVAVANSHRQDLNPIQRAELMQLLMRPIDQGGSGYELTQAGAIFGLTSESGCKNALRLLRLPASIRQLIIDGIVPERQARSLVPYTAAPKVMAAIEKELASPDADEFLYELTNDTPWVIIDAMREHTRPLSPDVEHSYPYPRRATPCLFDWTEHEDQLQVIELPHRYYDGKKKKHLTEPRKFALHTKLWDKLQEPLLKAREEAAAKSAAKGKSKGGKSSSAASAAPKLTPAQAAAEAKRKAKEADDRLNNFTREWACRMLRCTMAQACRDEGYTALILPWLVGQCPGHDLRSAHEAALLECRIAIKNGANAVIDAMPAVAKDHESRWDVMNLFARAILWPVSQLVGDTAKRSRLTPAGQLPDKLIPLGYQGELSHLTKLAGLYKLTLAHAWQAAATDDSDERRLVSVWLCRHTKDQLHALRTQLGVTEGSSTMGRDELAECILRMHRPGKPLPLPRRLAALSHSDA